jgi:hypothetical protein
MERFSTTLAGPFGLASQLLGWPPDIVWSATPSELAMALVPRATTAPGAPSHEQIRAMMERDDNG